MNLIKLTKSTGNENHKNDQEHGSIDELFKEMDLNEDGSISLVEFKEFKAKAHAKKKIKYNKFSFIKKYWFKFKMKTRNL